MDKTGFFRVAAAVPVVAIADTKTNTHRICSLIERAVNEQVSLLVFPEFCITGATCGDLFYNKLILDEAGKALDEIADFCASLPITVVLSAPLSVCGHPEQCRIVINRGEVSDIVKAGESRTYNLDGIRIAFQPDDTAHIALIPASDPEDIFFHDEIVRDICALSHIHSCAVVYCNAGYGESTGDSVYSGYSMVVENGRTIAEGAYFGTEPELVIGDIDIQEIESNKAESSYDEDGEEIGIQDICRTDFGKKLYREINAMPFIPDAKGLERAFEIQAAGLATRLAKINCEKAVIGISGGLDSTLALLCAVNAFRKLGLERKGIIGITMPGFGTSSRTHTNADKLMEELGVTRREIDITEACALHLKAIGHDGKTQDVTYENAQARERTQILMDIANAENAIVIGTGDLSELALGWCTYNGDHMSNYSVNASIPKTLIRAMVNYAADTEYKDTETGRILRDIVDTPVSPELKGNKEEIEQKTEDIVGPYELHDFFIWHIVGNGFSPEKTIFLAEKAYGEKYSHDEISKWMKIFVKRLISQQFKRSCAPDGPGVTPISFSPREGWCIPSDASANLMTENIK